jgi:ribosomal protein S18 acetylase RimI-like enzyme
MLGTMGYRIRDLDESSDLEVETVTRWCMETVLSTIPEFEGSPEKAQAALPNFTFDQMIAMIRADFPKPTHRFLVIENEDDGALVAHSMISRKLSPDGEAYGSFFSRFVLPAHRRRGLGGRLMTEAMAWFEGGELSYLLAHTHATNKALQGLFMAHGFRVVARSQTPWPTLTLRMDCGRRTDG